MERRVHRFGLAWTSRATVTAEIERQHSKSCRRERSSLLLPALLVERAAMGQHDASATLSVNGSVDYASVIGRKGNSLLRGGAPCKQQRHNDGNKRTHAANVLLLGQIRLVGIMGMCIPGFPRTLWEEKDRVLSGSSATLT